MSTRSVVWFSSSTISPSERDINSYNELLLHADLSDSWKEKYFKEQEQEVFENTQETITNDTKIQEVPSLDKPLVVGQIELWNGKEFIENYKDDIRKNLTQYNNPYWMMNIPSISEKRNYIFSENEEVQKILNQALGWEFKENLCVTEKLTLRKEILKSLYNL